MIVKLLTEHHLEFLSLKGDCRGSFESTHVKMSNCWRLNFSILSMFAIISLRKKSWMFFFMCYCCYVTVRVICLFLVVQHSGKSAAIREWNHGSGECIEHNT